MHQPAAELPHAPKREGQKASLRQSSQSETHQTGGRSETPDARPRPAGPLCLSRLGANNCRPDDTGGHTGRVQCSVERRSDRSESVQCSLHTWLDLPQTQKVRSQAGTSTVAQWFRASIHTPVLSASLSQKCSLWCLETLSLHILSAQHQNITL